MKNSYFELYEVLPNYKRRLVTGKNQFGDLKHAKEAAQKRRKEKVTWKHGDDPTSSQPTSLFLGYVFKKILKFEIRRIPKAKKMAKKNPEHETRELQLYADNIGPSAQGIETEVYEIRKKFGKALKSKQGKRVLTNLSKHGAHAAAKAYSHVHGSGATEWREIFNDKDLNDTAKYLYDSWFEEYSYTGNPKMARKKKRSAKQLANDKRLGRMAKARAKKKGKKKKGKKKIKGHMRRAIGGRRNPVRIKTTARKRALKKASQKQWFFIFRCYGNSVHFLGVGLAVEYVWKHSRDHAIAFTTKKNAARVAKGLSKKRVNFKYSVGVMNTTTTTAQIKAFCKGKV